MDAIPAGPIVKSGGIEYGFYHHHNPVRPCSDEQPAALPASTSAPPLTNQQTISDEQPAALPASTSAPPLTNQQTIVEKQSPVSKAKQICTPNTLECDGNWLKKCNSDGSVWNLYYKCPEGCSNSQCLAKERTTTPKPSPQDETKISPKLNQSQEVGPIDSYIKTNDSSLFKVVSVIDGDTIKIEMNTKVEKVRLLGIDSPETYKQKQCFGNEATSKMNKLVNGKFVRLEKDSIQPNRDRFGRLLRYVYLEDGASVNEEMVKQGYAIAYKKYNSDKLRSFIELESHAKSQKLGLWSSCSVFSRMFYYISSDN